MKRRRVSTKLPRRRFSLRNLRGTGPSLGRLERDHCGTVLFMKNTTLPAFATLQSRSTVRVALTLLALLPTLAPSAAAQTTLVERDLGVNLDLGLDAAPMGDLDGDNLPDLLVWSRGGLLGEPAAKPLIVQTLSGLTLETLQSFPVPANWTSAMGATPIGDRDGDGLQDIAIHSGLQAPEVGEVLIFSSATGQQLQALPNGVAIGSFGADVLDLGDVNGDGVSDLAVSEPERVVSTLGIGAIYVLSGADDQLLYTFPPLGNFGRDLGRYLHALGDIDGDGVQDFAASFGMAPSVGPPRAFIAISGATGSFLWVAFGVQWFGSSLEVVEDMDGDGVADIACLYDINCTGHPPGPWMVILSGATGIQLSSLRRPTAWAGCVDLSFSRTDDLDGDGLADFAVSIRNTFQGAGVISRVDFASSVTGEVLGSIDGEIDSQYGLSLAIAADLNEDGTSEVIVGGSRERAIGAGYPGYVSILSPVDSIPLTLVDGAFQWDNSTGTYTTMGAFGSTVASDNDVTLFARNMPPGSFGFFLSAPSPGVMSSSVGLILLSGPIGRFVGPGQIQLADATGRFSLPVDLTQWPTPTGTVSVTAGQTWYFQTWHRDAFGGIPTSRFSDRFEIEFE